MTTKQKTTILWDLLFIAEGLKRMTPGEIVRYNYMTCYGDLPKGICEAEKGLGFLEPLKNLIEKPNEYYVCCYWWPCGDWKIRYDVILNEIKKLN